jgi:hypothetical protein
MTTHTCPECGHEVKHDGPLDGPVEHLPDGGHKYAVTITVGRRIVMDNRAVR